MWSRCPTCGHPLPEENPCLLSPRQDIVFSAAKRAGQRGVHIDYLHYLLYDDQDRSMDAVYMLICRLNKRLRKHGLCLVTGSGRASLRRYRLVEL